MTIEELATDKTTVNYALKTERAYNNIRKMRNETLMRGFLCEKTLDKVKNPVTVSGVDYMDATNIHNLNSAWLLFEKINKSMIWIINKGLTTDKEINNIRKALNGKIKSIYEIQASENDMGQNSLTISDTINSISKIVTSDDCVVFMSFDTEDVNHNLSDVFSSTVQSL